MVDVVYFICTTKSLWIHHKTNFKIVFKSNTKLVVVKLWSSFYEKQLQYTGD